MMQTMLVTPALLDKYQVFDVRPAAAWEGGVVAGSVLLDLDCENFVEEFLKRVDTSKTPALLCTVGGRSRMAGELISKHKDDILVINLDGGVNELLKNGYKLAEFKK